MAKKLPTETTLLEDARKDSKAMGRVFELSLSEIEKVLAKEKAYTDVTKLAQATLGNYRGLRQTEVHAMALSAMMARTTRPKQIAG